MAKKFRYEYDGPYYYEGIKQPGEVKVYTEANTDNEAERNVIYKIKIVNKFSKKADIDIDRSKLKVIAFRVHNVLSTERLEKKQKKIDQLSMFD